MMVFAQNAYKRFHHVVLHIPNGARSNETLGAARAVGIGHTLPFLEVGKDEMDKWHTAIYEAEHAVIGHVLNMMCGDVTIVQDDDFAGYAICSDGRSTRNGNCKGAFVAILKAPSCAVASYCIGEPNAKSGTAGEVRFVSRLFRLAA